MRFLCLAYEDQTIFDDMPRAEWDALRTETLDYVESLRRDGTLVDAFPLKSARTATTLNIGRSRKACRKRSAIRETLPAVEPRP